MCTAGRGGILNPLFIVVGLLDAGVLEAAGVVGRLVLVTSLRGSSLLARGSRMPVLSPSILDE